MKIAHQNLAVVGVNDVLEPFGLKLSGDTPHIVNTGAIAKAGEINKDGMRTISIRVSWLRYS